MNKIPQTTPISRLNTHQSDVLEQMQEAPVLLLSRSTPVGVLVSVDEWNQIVDQLDDLAFLKEFVRKKRQLIGEPHVTLDELVQSAGVLA